MKRRDTGILGEKLARDFLEKRGYRIQETNYRCPEGEIDIVARHQDFLVFVEVRTKRSLDFGSPEESITLAKKERMRATAFYYQQRTVICPRYGELMWLPCSWAKRESFHALSLLKMRLVMSEAPPALPVGQAVLR